MTDVASAGTALSGLGSIAGAFGGGSGGGGAVVGGPSPVAANYAAQVQANAAREAADLARKSVQDAIHSINQNYAQARYDVQPYRTAGVQALNQLNQYLGLDAYNPGAAPTAPEVPTIENLKNDITKSQVRNYFYNNLSPAYNASGQFFGNSNYVGAGSDSNLLGAPTQGNSGVDSGLQGIRSGARLTGMDISGLLKNAGVVDQVKAELAEEMLQGKQQEYDDAKLNYDRNLAEWQQNLDWYNQYQAEGPLTSEQVVQRISGQPGYSAEMQQGVDAIGRSAAARGQVGSGNILKELTSFGQNTLSKYYNNTLDRLAGLASNGQQAAMSTAQNSQQLGQLIGNAQIGLGDTLANATLAGAQAKSQGILSANQQYKVIGGGGGGMK